MNDGRKAANAFARVVLLQPDHPDATLKLAEILYQAQRTGESLILINKILAQHQNYPDAWHFWPGLSWMKDGLTTLMLL